MERTVPIVPVLRKHHWYGAIMGPIQTLCTRALTELATPLGDSIVNSIVSAMSAMPELFCAGLCDTMFTVSSTLL